MEEVMSKPAVINIKELKKEVVRFSNSYFHIYHEISKELNENEIEQIGNFFTGSLYALKNIIESANPNSIKIEMALYKLKRFINEIVLLQYRISITRILLLSFLEASNKVIEILEKEVEPTDCK